jgi:hypothetical protein
MAITREIGGGGKGRETNVTSERKKEKRDFSLFLLKRKKGLEKRDEVSDV